MIGSKQSFTNRQRTRLKLLRCAILAPFPRYRHSERLGSAAGRTRHRSAKHPVRRATWANSRSHCGHIAKSTAGNAASATITAHSRHARSASPMRSCAANCTSRCIAIGARTFRKVQKREPVERPKAFRPGATPSSALLKRSSETRVVFNRLAKELVGNRVGRKRCRKTEHRCRAGGLLLGLRDRRAESRKDRARILGAARSVLEMLVDALQVPLRADHPQAAQRRCGMRQRQRKRAERLAQSRARLLRSDQYVRSRAADTRPRSRATRSARESR